MWNALIGSGAISRPKEAPKSEAAPAEEMALDSDDAPHKEGLSEEQLSTSLTPTTRRAAEIAIAKAEADQVLTSVF